MVNKGKFTLYLVMILERYLIFFEVMKNILYFYKFILLIKDILIKFLFLFYNTINKCI